MYDLSRNDYDVTNSVQVSSTAAVSAAVRELFTAAWPANPSTRSRSLSKTSTSSLRAACRATTASTPLYHDRQHSLDMTLAMARLLVGYERTVREPRMRFGAERAVHGAGHVAVP